MRLIKEQGSPGGYGVSGEGGVGDGYGNAGMTNAIPGSGYHHHHGKPGGGYGKPGGGYPNGEISLGPDGTNSLLYS